MATLLPSKTTKSEEPRNAHEERIALARKGMENGDALWRSGSNAKKSEETPMRTPVHLSGLGVSTIKGISPLEVKRADTLAKLPAAVRQKAEPLSDGQKDFIARVYEIHAATGDYVEFTTAEAASVMKTDMHGAERTLAGLEQAGIIARKYSALGTFKGYVPGPLA